MTNTLTHYLLLFGTPGLFVFLATHFLAGPVISAHHLALEGAHAYEQHHGWDRLDGYCDRLLNSRNVKERNSIIIARTLFNDYPILVHLKLAFEHFHSQVAHPFTGWLCLANAPGHAPWISSGGVVHDDATFCAHREHTSLTPER